MDLRCISGGLGRIGVVGIHTESGGMRGYLRWTVCSGPTGCYSDGEQPVRLTAGFGCSL